MDPREIDHIQKNLSKLLRLVHLKHPLLAILVEDRIISSYDRGRFEHIQDREEEVKEKEEAIKQLLKLIQLKKGGFMALIKALERTQQIEAVMVLKQLYDSSPSASQSTPQSGSSTGFQEIEARTLIERNYAALVRLIDCDRLLRGLMGRNQLSHEDLAVIMSREFPIQRAESLLNIILTRVGGYAALIKALEETNQSTTTAFDILSGKLDTGPSNEASSSSEPTAFEEGPARFAELINKITEYEHKYNRNMLQRELPEELFHWVAIGAKLNVKVRNPNDDEKVVSSL
ncbi:unnamed protein product [Orchesella dallaii]|uniref:CARD domain-containing protein n=1 Tax=Orchesella dallaii TaxID=48710 RepID=A0ABP1RI83_9HEXA